MGFIRKRCGGKKKLRNGTTKKVNDERSMINMRLRMIIRLPNRSRQTKGQQRRQSRQRNSKRSSTKNKPQRIQHISRLASQLALSIMRLFSSTPRISSRRTMG